MEEQQHERTGRLPQPDDSRRRPTPDAAEVIGARFWRAVDEIDRAVAAAGRRGAAIWEPSMLPKTRRLLRQFPVAGMERPYLNFLEQRIQRNPRDLLSHVRRVIQLDALGDSDRAYGALVDVFLILGRRGRPLRGRLYRLVAAGLSPDQRRFLRDYLDSGLHAGDISVDVPHARLARQMPATGRAVVRRKGDEIADSNPVERARVFIASGRADLAQAVLERALGADPGDEDVVVELLALYRQEDQGESLLKTYTAFLGRSLALPGLWQELAARYRTERIAGGG